MQLPPMSGQAQLLAWAGDRAPQDPAPLHPAMPLSQISLSTAWEKNASNRQPLRPLRTAQQMHPGVRWGVVKTFLSCPEEHAPLAKHPQVPRDAHMKACHRSLYALVTGIARNSSTNATSPGASRSPGATYGCTPEPLLTKSKTHRHQC